MIMMVMIVMRMVMMVMRMVTMAMKTMLSIYLSIHVAISQLWNIYDVIYTSNYILNTYHFIFKQITN